MLGKVEGEDGLCTVGDYSPVTTLESLWQGNEASTLIVDTVTLTMGMGFHCGPHHGHGIPP